MSAEKPGLPLGRVGYQATFSGAEALLEASDYLYLLAWSTVPGSAEKNPLEDLQQNVVATVSFLESMKQMDNPPKVIFISTGGAIYGNHSSDCIHSETDCVHPISAYAIGKMVVENYLVLFHRQFGLDYLIARPSNPFGVGQRPDACQGAVAVFLGKMLRNEPIEIWGDGEVIRDYLYIDDLAAGLAALADYDPGESGERLFNFGFGKGYSLNLILDFLASVTGIKPEVRYTEARDLDVPAVVLDNSRAKELLNWRCDVPVVEGIAKTWNWLRQL